LDRNGFWSDPPASTQSGIVQIAGAGQSALALTATGRVIAWGRPGTAITNVPVAAQSGVKAIAGGSEAGFAIKNDNSLVAWGENSNGLRDVPAAARTNVLAVAAGTGRAIALKADGTVVEWGPASTPVPAVVRGATAIADSYDDSSGTPSFAIVPAPTTTVRLKQSASGKCMTAPATDAQSWIGHDLTLEPCSDALWDRQQFQRSFTDTYYTRFQSWYDQGYLDSSYGGVDNGTHVVLGPLSTASTSQKWLDNSADPNVFGSLIQEKSGLVLDTPDSSTDDGVWLVIGRFLATQTQNWKSQ
jgi:hypothetical protein